MEKETTNKTRFWLIGVCLLVATFAQVSLKKLFPWLSYIDWLLLITVYVSLMRNPVVAMFTGTAAGVFHDLASGVPSSGVPPFGISGISYVVAAYIGFWVSTSFLVEGLLIRAATVAGAGVVAAILRLSLYTFTVDVAMPKEAALELILGPTCNLIVSVILFAALDQVFDFGRRAKMRRAEAMRGANRRRKWLVKNNESRWKIKRRKRFRFK